MEQGWNSSPALAGTRPREIKGRSLVYPKCLKCMANPGTPAVICLPSAWGGALGPRSVTLLRHHPSSVCHRAATAPLQPCMNELPRARTPGMVIPSSTRRGVPGTTMGQKIPVPAQCRKGQRVCTLPHRTPLPCLTKVTATLWLWPELLHRGRRRCPPCRHKCCAQPCLPLHLWRSDTTHRIRDSSAASPG